MRNAIEEKIKEDVRSGQVELVIRSYIQRQRLDSKKEQFYFDLLDDEIAIQKLRDVKIQDAKLLIYLAYILVVPAIYFSTHHLAYGAAIIIFAVLIRRRGMNKISEAESIKSIAQLLPEEPTKFHKRRI